MTTKENDATVAAKVYGWTEIRLELGRFRGKPPVGLRKDVPSYSSDLRLAMQVAKRVSCSVDSELKISIERDAIEVRIEDEGGFPVAARYETRLADLPSMIIDCSLVAIRRPIASSQRGVRA